MIQKIIISNFFSIREPLEVSFEASKEKQFNEDWIIQIGSVRLLKAILLYGANGSGKTNILCALDFLRALTTTVPSNVENQFSYMPFAMDPEWASRDTSFDLFFFIGLTRYYYHVSLTREMIKSEELRIFQNGNNSRLVFSRNYKEDKKINVVRFGTWLSLTSKERKLIEENTKGVISVLSVYASKNVACEELDIIRNYFKHQFFRLYQFEGGDQEVAKAIRENPRLKSLLIEMLKSFHSNIIDINIEEEIRPISEETRQAVMQLSTSAEEKEQISKLRSYTRIMGQYVHKTEKGEILIEDSLQSEGTRAFLRYLVLFFKAIRNNKLIALDEFGSGLQAKSLNLLLDFFLKFSKGAQLIFATQSLGFLDYPNMRRDAIQIVSKDEIGQSKIDSKTVRSIHKNIKLRKAYIDGRFASIDPNEPDINFEKERDKYQELVFGAGEEGGVQ